jgi:GNAT superfamily N-acetyltransferase
MKNQIPHLNLFMMCTSANTNAFRDLPDSYHFRTCRPSELDTWKYLSIKDPQHFDYMTEYYNLVYATNADLFFEKCLFACDKDDIPIGTCFIWKAYNQINTLHWFRVLPSHEGKGVGRALLTELMKNLTSDDYPVYLHTHPTGYRAIRLYSDFGFQLLSDPMIGYRKNELDDSMPFLEEYMPRQFYDKLKITSAPDELIEASLLTEYEQF